MKLLLYFKHWLFTDSEHQNRNWYVWGTLALGVIGTFGIVKIQQPVEEIKANISEIYDHTLFNTQNMNTSRLDGSAFVSTYYSLIQKLDFENSCTLLSKRMCDANNVSQFTQYVKDSLNYHTRKLRAPEQLIEEPWKAPNQNGDTTSELWCAKISFVLEGESESVDQVWRFKIFTRPDGGKEIATKQCEKAYKQGLGDRSIQMGCTSDHNCINR